MKKNTATTYGALPPYICQASNISIIVEGNMKLNHTATHTYDTALQFAAYFEPEWQPYFYILWKKYQEGHICVPEQDLDSALVHSVFPGVERPKSKKEFMSDGSSVKPIIQLNGNLYLHRYFTYETIIIDKIKALIAWDPGTRLPDADISSLSFSDECADAGTDWQSVAVAASLVNNFTIITGGPGTGKTTTVARILELLFAQNPELKVALAAPTGKAAARMAESLKEKAAGFDEKMRKLFEELMPSTIHRLLGNKPDSIYFRHNKENPLPYDVMIIDESSMIDVALFAKLLDAVAPGTKLVMLGDKNQLASVEAGSLFGDLCTVPGQLNVFSEKFQSELKKIATGKAELQTSHNPSALSDHIIELQKSYRFSDDRGIGRLSRIIIREDLPGLEIFMQQPGNDVVIDLAYSAKLLEEFILKFKSYILEPDIAIALKKFNDYRILCALRDGKNGLYETNRIIEAILENAKLIKRDKPFYENRPVTITKNNYQLGLYNGDTGIVRKDADGTLKVWFDMNGTITGFAPSLISNEETSFAITIHKSQGSEFKEVIVLLPDYDVPVMTKELIYTAITRAKEKVFLQTNKQVLENAVMRSVKRGSGLKERFLK